MVRATGYFDMLSQCFFGVCRWAKFGVICCACLIGTDVFAGDDDQIVVLNAAAETNEHDNFEANFEQWVFAGSPSAAVGRKRMEAQAKLQIGEIERSCRLSSEQKSRLELAARGDV